MIENILAKFANAGGWSYAEQISLLCVYIENQKSDDAFTDFLQQKADEDGSQP